MEGLWKWGELVSGGLGRRKSNERGTSLFARFLPWSGVAAMAPFFR